MTGIIRNPRITPMLPANSAQPLKRDEARLDPVCEAGMSAILVNLQTAYRPWPGEAE